MLNVVFPTKQLKKKKRKEKTRNFRQNFSSSSMSKDLKLTNTVINIILTL